MKAYSIANRTYTYHSSIPDELGINSQLSYLCELPHVACLSVIGDKNQAFLQGQLSCDITHANADHYAKGALCNLQGRIKALIDVIHCHDYQLVMPADLLESVKKDFKTAAMLSRVQLHQSENYTILGLVGNPEDEAWPALYRLPEGNTFLLQKDFCCYQVAPNVYLLLLSNEKAQTLVEHYRQIHQFKGSLLWHYHYLNNGFFSIYPQTSDRFLPHKVSLQNLGYLNFKKGCYKGQEIIARMHYRAKLKNELRMFELETSAPVVLNAPLYDPDNHQEVGEIIDFCPLSEQKYLIAASILIDVSVQPVLSAN